MYCLVWGFFFIVLEWLAVLEVNFPQLALLLINITETELHNICNCCYNGLVFRDLDDYMR